MRESGTEPERLVRACERPAVKKKNMPCNDLNQVVRTIPAKWRGQERFDRISLTVTASSISLCVEWDALACGELKPMELKLSQAKLKLLVSRIKIKVKSN